MAGALGSGSSYYPVASTGGGVIGTGGGGIPAPPPAAPMPVSNQPDYNAIIQQMMQQMQQQPTAPTAPAAPAPAQPAAAQINYPKPPQYAAPAPYTPTPAAVPQSVQAVQQYAGGLMDPSSGYFQRLSDAAKAQIGKAGQAQQRAAALRAAYGGLGGGRGGEMMQTQADIGQGALEAMGGVGADLALQAPRLGLQAMQGTFAPELGYGQLGEQSRQFGYGQGQQAGQFGAGLAAQGQQFTANMGLAQQQAAAAAAAQQAQQQADYDRMAMQQQQANLAIMSQLFGGLM